MSADVRSDVTTAREGYTAQVRGRAWQQSGLGSKRWLARWFAVMGVIGAALLAASLVTPGAALEEATPAAVVITIALCLVVCVIPSLRGERLHVAEVLAMVVFVDAVIAYVGSIVAEGPGTEEMLMLLTWPTLIAAVYLPRPMVVAQVLAGTAAGTSTFPELLATPGVAALQIGLLASSLAVVALVVTQLRERLTDALDLARHVASTDALTGIANRRGIEERLPALWASAARRGECLEVVLVDIDHFKAVNDRHGHSIGDQVLAQVAALVSSSVRTSDLVGRFGGEEFLALAAVDQGADPGQVGERIRHAVQEESGPVPVTVSVGSTTIVPTQGVDVLEALYQQVQVADQAMYESKRAGRNRLTLR